MSERTAIEWADSTFNPWIGCTKVGPGCDHCYAEALMDTRQHRVKWGAGNSRSRTSAANWKEPLLWNRQHETFLAEHGHRRRVFCASLADVFDNEVTETWRWDLFRLILATPNLDWLLLTKRIGNARAMLNAAAGAALNDFVGAPSWDSKCWPNVWIGATVVNQDEADRDIPKLLDVPSRIRFLSIEPMLGPINIARSLYWLTGRPCFVCRMEDSTGGARGSMSHPINCGWRRDQGLPQYSTGIDWVIAGGESGHHARPAHPDWIRSLRDQCATAGVPFQFKQWGEWLPGENHGEPEAKWQDGATGQHPTCRDRPDSKCPEWRHTGTVGDFGAFHLRVGKKAAGRLLDGVEHNGFPR